MKKFTSLILAIALLILSIPLNAFAKEQSISLVKNHFTIEQEIPDKDLQMMKEDKRNRYYVEKDSETSLLAKLFDKFTGAFWQIQKNILYYLFISVGVILLLDKIQFLNKDDIIKEIGNIDLNSICQSFNEFLSNISVSKVTKLIYDPEKKFITLKEISNSLREFSGAHTALKGVWNYFKINGAIIWTGSILGSTVGFFGKLFGISNVGWLYGMFMLPYLFKFRSNVGDCEVLANFIDLCEYAYQNTSQRVKDFLNSFFQ